MATWDSTRSAGRGAGEKRGTMDEVAEGYVDGNWAATNRWKTGADGAPTMQRSDCNTPDDSSTLLSLLVASEGCEYSFLSFGFSFP